MLCKELFFCDNPSITNLHLLSPHPIKLRADIIVDLPEPTFPTIATFEPFLILSEIFLSAKGYPYFRDKLKFYKITTCFYFAWYAYWCLLIYFYWGISKNYKHLEAEDKMLLISMNCLVKFCNPKAFLYKLEAVNP